MDPDLVGSSCEYLNTHQGSLWQLTHDFVVALTVFSFLMSVRRASQPVFWVVVDLVFNFGCPLCRKASLDYEGFLLRNRSKELSVVPVTGKKTLDIILMLLKDSVAECIVNLFNIVTLKLLA